MAQSARQALMLNNLGAERFAAGELSEALDAYRRALAFIPAHAKMGTAILPKVQKYPNINSLGPVALMFELSVCVCVVVLGAVWSLWCWSFYVEST